MKTVICPTAAD